MNIQTKLLTNTNRVLASIPIEFFPEEYEGCQDWIDEISQRAKILMESHSGDGTKFQMPEFDQFSQMLSNIKSGATGWKALEIIYNFKIDECNDPLARFWVNMRNAQAVRNRFQYAKVLLQRVLEQRMLATGKGSADRPLCLLSLAAGSAQAVLETVAYMRNERDIHVRITLIDNDASVRSKIKHRIQQLGVGDCVRFIEGSAFKFRTLMKEESSPDVVEMLGLLDYLNDKFANRLCRGIYQSLDDGGYFLTCHIHPNPEQDFLRYVINWGHNPYMHYRSKEELERIVNDAGFTRTQTYTEPHKIHTIAVGIK